MKKQAVFRVDSGALIGAGHIMRCLTLANVFIENGYVVHVITRKRSGFIGKGGSKVYWHLLDEVSDNLFDRYDYKTWIGSSYENEKSELERIFKKIGKISLLVIDHYGIDKVYQKFCRTFVNKIMVIDDLMEQEHDCDFLLDQNLSASQITYQNLCGPLAKLMLGPQYALLRPEFHNQRLKGRIVKTKIENILIYLGSCRYSAVKKVLVGLAQISTEVAVTVIVPSNQAEQAIEDVDNLGFKNFEVKGFVNNISEIYGKIDLCVGACGSSTWERCCLGVPSVVLTVADNQNEIGAAIHDKKAAYLLGDIATLSSDHWKTFFENKLEDISFWNSLSKSAYEVVDGLGVKRVFDLVSGEK